jgi:hypothetical protein
MVAALSAAAVVWLAIRWGSQHDPAGIDDNPLPILLVIIVLLPALFVVGFALNEDPRRELRWIGFASLAIALAAIALAVIAFATC